MRILAARRLQRVGGNAVQRNPLPLPVPSLNLSPLPVARGGRVVGGRVGRRRVHVRECSRAHAHTVNQHGPVAESCPGVNAASRHRARSATTTGPQRPGLTVWAVSARKASFSNNRAQKRAKLVEGTVAQERQRMGAGKN
jgi:hypothetical protein